MSFLFKRKQKGGDPPIMPQSPEPITPNPDEGSTTVEPWDVPKHMFPQTQREEAKQQEVKKTPSSRIFGLMQVYPNQNDAESTNKTEIDVIALHGLDAESRVTWNAWEDENDPASRTVNWLKDSHMLPSVIPNARILTYDWNANYDKTASSDIFLGHADALLDRIHNRQQYPIIFVASCFSGLLLSKALLRAVDGFAPRANQNRDIFHSTVGVAFLGTPFQGSWNTGYTAAQLRLAVARESGFECSQELVEYIRGASGHRSLLDDLVQRFTEMIHDQAFKFDIVCFYETRHTNFSAILKKLPPEYVQEQIDPNGHGIVVERYSACLQGVANVGLDCRHNMLHKYGKPTGDGFLRLSTRLREFADNADEVLKRKERHQQERALTSSDIIANWLPSALDYSATDADRFSRLHPGTGQWFLRSKEFNTWKTTAQATLFCPGLQGTGKTFMSSLVINHLFEYVSKDRNSAVAYLYCNFECQEQQEAGDLFTALLKQLLSGRRRAPPPEDVNLLYNRHKSASSKPYIGEILKALWSIISSYSKVFIVVDALDECRKPERKRLLSELLGFQRTLNLNLLATSRNDLIIQAELGNCPSLPIRANEGDVRSYVEAHISGVSDLIAEESPQFINDIVQRIVAGSGGMFLLAHVFLKSLEDKLTVRDVRSAVEGFQASRESTGQTELLETLWSAYARSIRRISLQRKGFRDLARKVLNWLTFAERPLTMGELVHALAIDVGKRKLGKENFFRTQDIVTACAGLVTIEKESDIVRLIHHTTKEFLSTQISCLNEGNNQAQTASSDTRMVSDPNKITETKSNIQRQLTQACITYLSYDTFRAGHCQVEADFLERLREYPLYRYAASNWGRHARRLLIAEEREVFGLILNFLEHRGLLSASTQAIGYEGQISFRVHELYERYYSPIAVAAHFGILDVLTSLLKRNHDPGLALLREDETPMVLAASEGHTAIVKILFESQVLRTDAEILLTRPLKFAVKNGHEAVVRYLLEKRGYRKWPKDDDIENIAETLVKHDLPLQNLLIRYCKIQNLGKDWPEKLIDRVRRISMGVTPEQVANLPLVPSELPSARK
ncbi:hypothetical protein NUW58_g4975 [Xylaria curta]|uniref:Uncharacterized protein n=1 Tax=Xylaria curta TaxID=42375 RepID=A0ACC1P3V6_9PEZI|nr:hypothetical protein NUW58_g4975 [Xylaria curta]